MGLESGLVDRARAGDLAAFEELVSPLIEPASQLACAILRDWHEAEDAVQEATFKAWRAVGKLRDDTTNLRAWYLTIVATKPAHAAAAAGGASSGWPTRAVTPPVRVPRSTQRRASTSSAPCGG